MNNMEISREEEIADVRKVRPHVVILGAGGSVAALPDGDKNGKYLPTMDNFIKVLDLENLVSSISIKSNNFEKIYSEICLDPKLSDLRKSIEQNIYNYFSSLELPEEPNLYDYLLLSLRKKDMIFTFNWDPFLIQAYQRNSKFTKELPTLSFLHGNVMVGSCIKHTQRGAIHNRCSVCGDFFSPSPLLFPITNKDYNSDPFIKNEWEMFDWALNNTLFVTIFGYGAPETDINAIETMKKSWSKPGDRAMEEFEIIDVKDEDTLYKLWEPFIHTHHYRVKNIFYDSWIANHPRRSIEAYFNQFWDGKFIDNNPFPKDCTFKEIWSWFRNLIDAESIHHVD
jgi:hypothetical protein